MFTITLSVYAVLATQVTAWHWQTTVHVALGRDLLKVALRRHQTSLLVLPCVSCVCSKQLLHSCFLPAGGRCRAVEAMAAVAGDLQAAEANNRIAREEHVGTAECVPVKAQ